MRSQTFLKNSTIAFQIQSIGNGHIIWFYNVTPPKTKTDIFSGFSDADFFSTSTNSGYSLLILYISNHTAGFHQLVSEHNDNESLKFGGQVGIILFHATTIFSTQLLNDTVFNYIGVIG